MTESGISLRPLNLGLPEQGDLQANDQQSLFVQEQERSQVLQAKKERVQQVLALSQQLSSSSSLTTTVSLERFLKSIDKMGLVIIEIVSKLQAQLEGLDQLIVQSQLSLQFEMEAILKTLQQETSEQLAPLGLPLEEKPQENSGVEQDIKTKISDARYKYLLGKIAGERLESDQGGIIIEKNEQIEIEHIQKAEREGKLSDLIINMLSTVSE